MLARGKVRYAGEAVALVVAESRALAEDAAELVELDYEPLEPVLHPRAAAAGPLLHDHVPENALVRWSRVHGDVEAAFADAHATVSQSFLIPRLVAAPIEPRGAIARPTRRATSSRCGAPRRTPTGRSPSSAMRWDAIAIACGSSCRTSAAPSAARARSAPRWRPWPPPPSRSGARSAGTEDRTENFLSAYQGRGVEADVELALAADGRHPRPARRTLRRPGRLPYPTTAVAGHTTAMLLGGTYAIPAVAVELLGAATNKVPTGPYRGAGRPEAAFLIERMVDLAARELGLDPSSPPPQLRPAGAFPYETPLGWTYDSGDFERCLDAAIELGRLDGGVRSRRALGRTAGSSARARHVRRTGGRPVGERGRAGGAGRSRRRPHRLVAARAGARDDVRAGRRRRARGRSRRRPHRLGRLRRRCPPGIGTFASRSVAMGGSALAVTARELVARAAERGVSVVELAAAEGGVEASGRFSSGLVFASGAYLAVVEVDRETGRLSVLSLAAVDDSGRIVNPLLAEGQVLGATVQGLGQCLVEEAVHDEEGQLRTSSFADYSLLTAAELPPIESRFVETPPRSTRSARRGSARVAPSRRRRPSRTPSRMRSPRSACATSTRRSPTRSSGGCCSEARRLCLRRRRGRSTRRSRCWPARRT